MTTLYKAFSEEKRAEFDQWAASHVNGRSVADSDWPGWYEYMRIPSAWLEEPAERIQSKQPIPADLRWEVYERDNFTCRKCGARRFLSVDHIHPESRGGTLDLSNLQTLCKSCNSRKGATVLSE
jgi:rubredoxin